MLAMGAFQPQRAAVFIVRPLVERFDPKLQDGCRNRLYSRDDHSCRHNGIRVHRSEEWRQTSGGGTVRSRFKRLYGPRPKCSLGFRKIKIGQLKEGVDMFYSDFRNKAIDIEFALAYLRDQLEAELKGLRRSARR